MADYNDNNSQWTMTMSTGNSAESSSINSNLEKISSILESINSHISDSNGDADKKSVAKGKADDGSKKREAKGNADIPFEKFATSVNRFGGFVTNFGKKVSDFSKIVSEMSNAKKSGGVGEDSSADIKALIATIKAEEKPKLKENASDEEIKEFVKKERERAEQDKKIEKERKKQAKEDESKKSFSERRREQKEKEKEEKQEKREKQKNEFAAHPGRSIAKGLLWATQHAGSAFNSLATGKVNASSAIDKGIGAISKMGIAGGIIGTILSVIKTGFDIYTKKERDAQTYVRTHGGGASGMREYMDSSLRFVGNGISWKDAIGFKKRIQYTDDDFNKAMELISSGTGRAGWRKTDSDLRSAADLARFGIGPDVIKSFDTFGKSLENTDKFIAQTYGRSGRLGISFKALSAAVNNNLKMAQTHTFAGGLKGLQRMAEKSVELKYNMNTIAAAADKMSTVEGAIKTGSQLQVLGGSFAAYANPMQLLYDSLADMESLNDRIISMFGDKAFFNKDKGEIDMSVFNKQRMKAASEAMGIDYGDMLNIAYNNERGNIVERQLTARLDDDTMRYLKNIAQLDEKGRAYIGDGNGGRKYVSDIRSGDAALIAQESKAKDLQKGDERISGIWGETMTIADTLDNLFTYIQQKLGIWVMKIAEKMVKVIQWIKRAVSAITGLFKSGATKGREIAQAGGQRQVYDEFKDSLQNGYSYVDFANDLVQGNLDNIRSHSTISAGDWAKFEEMYNNAEKTDTSDIPGAEFMNETGERGENAEAIKAQYGRQSSGSRSSGSGSRHYGTVESGGSFTSSPSSSYSTPAISTPTHGPTKVQVEPIKLTINGEISLKNNGQMVDIKLTPQQMDELGNSLTPLINAKIKEFIEQGKNMDSHMYDFGISRAHV